MISFSLPNISDIERLSNEQDTARLKSYLANLTNQLSFILGEIDTDNLSGDLLNLVVGEGSSKEKLEKLEKLVEDISASYNTKFKETEKQIESVNTRAQTLEGEVERVNDRAQAIENKIQIFDTNGYGKKAFGLKSSQRIENDTELTAEMAKVYDAMADAETKLIAWYGYPSTGGNGWFGILSRSSINNGGLTAHSAYGGGSLVVKTKYSTVWQDLEWENPPMQEGTEYRTTERHLGKPVYKKRVTISALPASGQQNTAISGVSGVNIISFSAVATEDTTKQMFPVVAADGTVRARMHMTNTNIIVQVNHDMSGYKAIVDLKYTKS